MLICHCKRVTCTQLKECKTLREAQEKTGASTGCGGCIFAVCQVIGDSSMTYEYKCLNCGHEWEHEAKITEEPLKTCPECKRDTAKRLVSGGLGFQLNGSGWFNKGGY